MDLSSVWRGEELFQQADWLHTLSEEEIDDVTPAFSNLDNKSAANIAVDFPALMQTAAGAIRGGMRAAKR